MQNKTKQNKESKVVAMETKQEPQVTLEQVIGDKLALAQGKDENIKIYPVTGYTTVKYGNKVLVEFHIKKRSISHLTFSQKQKVFELLKAKKLIHRVVPASYGWKYDTECLLTPEFAKNFDEILASIISEAIEERNLKDKKTEKKQAKA